MQWRRRIVQYHILLIEAKKYLGKWRWAYNDSCHNQDGLFALFTPDSWEIRRDDTSSSPLHLFSCTITSQGKTFGRKKERGTFVRRFLSSPPHLGWNWYDDLFSLTKMMKLKLRWYLFPPSSRLFLPNYVARKNTREEKQRHIWRDLFPFRLTSMMTLKWWFLLFNI